MRYMLTNMNTESRNAVRQNAARIRAARYTAISSIAVLVIPCNNRVRVEAGKREGEIEYVRIFCKT